MEEPKESIAKDINFREVFIKTIPSTKSTECKYKGK